MKRSRIEKDEGDDDSLSGGVGIPSPGSIRVTQVSKHFNTFFFNITDLVAVSNGEPKPSEKSDCSNESDFELMNALCYCRNERP